MLGGKEPPAIMGKQDEGGAIRLAGAGSQRERPEPPADGRDPDGAGVLGAL